MAKNSKVETEMPDQLRMDYAGTFNTEAGRRVLEDIMSTCHVLEPEQDNIPDNIIARAHRRDVAHHILSGMGYGPQDFPKLVEDLSNG